MNALPQSSCRSTRGPKNSHGFTLVEILVVISIILVMMGLLVPAFKGIQGGSDLTKAAYDIQGTLDQARAYAVANNTFVYVGIIEVDSSVDPSVSPQRATVDPAVGGRVAMAVVASKDGTRGYNIAAATLPNPAWDNNGAQYNNGASLVAIGKLQRFENVHLAPLFSSFSPPKMPNPGELATRPSMTSATYMLGNKACASVTPFDWPLGKNIGAGQYSFTRVINFDPQGVARIQTASNQDFLNRYIEIGLMAARGNTVPTPITNAAAIQIDGITGATHIYRP